MLEVFAGSGINLTRIESIPTEPGSYSFLVDFEGSDTDPVVMVALEKTREISEGLKLLGCYPEKNIENDDVKPEEE